MKLVGDLVKLESVFKDGVPMYSTWGNKEDGDEHAGIFRPSEIGIVFETTIHRGGNGVRVIVSGRIGWVNHNFLIDVV